MDLDQIDTLLLTTKLTIPVDYHTPIVARTHLYEQLDGSLQHALTLITAPAGFGKTTGIRGWIQHRDLTAAWVTLEKTDNDLIRFWRYCITALSQATPNLWSVDKNWQQTLQTATIESFLTTIINTLMEIDHDIILVLDDYHTITASSIHQTLTFLIDHMPPRLHLLLCGRNAPSLPLARARVQGKLIEIRTEQLRFRQEEIRLLLTQSIKRSPTNRMVTALHQQTQGWIAGLKLTLKTLQGKKDIAEIMHCIQTFTGTNRHILHYITDEIISNQPAEIQNFLFQTSILKYLTPSLCNALTGEEYAAEVLDYLDQANLFLLPLVGQPDWYCYEPLFAEALNYHLKQRQPDDQITQLHQRASYWLEQHGNYQEAIQQALLAGEIKRASNLIIQSADSFLQQEKGEQLASWLEALTTDLIENHPMLSYLSAYTLARRHRITEAEQALQNAEQAWSEQEDMSMSSRIANLRAQMDLQLDDGRQAVIHSQQALEQLCEKDREMRSNILMHLGAGYYLSGKIKVAQQTLMAAYHLNQQQGKRHGMLATTIYSGKIQRAQGKLKAAAQTFQHILNERNDRYFTYRLAAHIHLGEINLEWNDLSNATKYSQQTQQLIEEYQYTGPLLIQHALCTGKLAWALGNHDQVYKCFDLIDQYRQRSGEQRKMLAQELVTRIQFYLAQKEMEQAEQWLHIYTQDGQALQFYDNEALTQAQSRWLIQCDQADEAIQMLTRAYNQIKHDQEKRVESELIHLILLARAYQAGGNMQQALHILEQALHLREPGGYIRIFVDEGVEIAKLLIELFHRRQKKTGGESHSIPPGIIYTLLNSFGSEISTSNWSSISEHEYRLIDRLSEREYTVLKLIAEGLSNQDIACRLVVTVSTIKTHLNNIYAKLHVHTRLQAVTKAYDLNLLSRNESDTEPLARSRPVGK